MPNRRGPQGQLDSGDRVATGPARREQPLIASIVIPTIGRTRSLSRCLRSGLSQTADRDSYEVIVVDDASSADYGWLDASVVLVRLATWRGPGGARNAGVAAANADVVAFLDDDQTVSRTWLEELTGALSQHPQVSAAGSYVPAPRRTRCVVCPSEARVPMAFDCWLLWSRGSRRADLSPAWGSGNIAYRRDVLLALGGFREGVSAGEDGDLAARAGAAGDLTFHPQPSYPLAPLHVA